MNYISFTLISSLNYGQLNDILYGMVRYGLVLNDMVHGYYQDVLPCPASRVASGMYDKLISECYSSSVVRISSHVRKFLQ